MPIRLPHQRVTVETLRTLQAAVAQCFTEAIKLAEAIEPETMTVPRAKLIAAKRASTKRPKARKR
ncbi:MAG: hypothetical protein ABI634_06240 [Acidobacteriota bacterium]